MCFRYNKSNNLGPQLIINYLVAYSKRYPLKAESLKRIPRKDYSEIYYVENILDKRESLTNPSEFEYLLHWKNFPLYRSTWHPKDNLEDPSMIEAYDMLPEADKNTRRKRYADAVASKAQRDINNHCIPYLTLDKVDKFAQATIRRNAMEHCILKNKIFLIEQKQETKEDNQIYYVVKACIEGTTTEGEKFYAIKAEFLNGFPVSWECECEHFVSLQCQQASGIRMCKHVYASILEVSAQGQNKIAKARLNRNDE